jgi:hypothetical protein
MYSAEYVCVHSDDHDRLRAIEKFKRCDSQSAIAIQMISDCEKSFTMQGLLKKEEIVTKLSEGVGRGIYRWTGITKSIVQYGIYISEFR